MCLWCPVSSSFPLFGCLQLNKWKMFSFSEANDKTLIGFQLTDKTMTI